MILLCLLLIFNGVGSVKCQSICNNGQDRPMINISTIYTKDNRISDENLYYQIRKEFFADQLVATSNNNLFYFNITIEPCSNESLTLMINCTNCVLKTMDGVSIGEAHHFQKKVLDKELAVISFEISNQSNNNILFDIVSHKNGTQLLKETFFKVCFKFILLKLFSTF